MDFFPFINKPNPDEDEVKKNAEAAEQKYKQDTGKDIPDEEGLEEGDLYDYVAPFTGLGRSAAKAGLEKAGQAAAEEAEELGVKKYGKEAAEEAKQVGGKVIDYAKQYINRPKPAPEPENTLNYGEINKIQQKPSSGTIDYGNPPQKTITEATTGFTKPTGDSLMSILARQRAQIRNK